MNQNQQQNDFMQDDNQCEHDYKIVPGIGKICVKCGQGPDYQKEEKIKSKNEKFK